MEKDQKIGKIALVVIAIVLAIYSIVSSIREKNELKKYGVPANAEITFIQATRGSYELDIKFKYKNQWYKSYFGKGNVDSMKIGTRVLVLVSGRDPTGALKYLHVIQ